MQLDSAFLSSNVFTGFLVSRHGPIFYHFAQSTFVTDEQTTDKRSSSNDSGKAAFRQKFLMKSETKQDMIDENLWSMKKYKLNILKITETV